MTRRMTALLGALLLVAWVGSAGARDQRHPGYVDLSGLAGPEEAEVLVDVRLGGWLLGWMRAAAEQSDDEDLAVLSSIDSIRVRIVHMEGQRFASRAQQLIDTLSGEGWEDFARVRKDGHWAQVMVKGSESRIDGITVLAMESGDEAVFVNIAGRLDPGDIARILSDKDLIRADIDLGL